MHEIQKISENDDGYGSQKYAITAKFNDPKSNFAVYMLESLNEKIRCKIDYYGQANCLYIKRRNQDNPYFVETKYVLSSQSLSTAVFNIESLKISYSYCDAADPNLLELDLSPDKNKKNSPSDQVISEVSEDYLHCPVLTEFFNNLPMGPNNSAVARLNNDAVNRLVIKKLSCP